MEACEASCMCVCVCLCGSTGMKQGFAHVNHSTPELQSQPGLNILIASDFLVVVGIER